VIVNGEQRHVVSCIKDFLFSPEQARTPIRELSGGERARLLLARVLAHPANLLILDELITTLIWKHLICCRIL